MRNLVLFAPKKHHAWCREVQFVLTHYSKQKLNE